MAAAEQGIAGTITLNNQKVDVGVVDTLIGSTNLTDLKKSSNPKAETSWVKEVLYPESVEYTFKIETVDGTGWKAVYDTNTEGNSELNGAWALSLGSYEPGYFLVKTGNVSDTSFTHFLFENNDLLGWAVIDLTTMGITLENIASVSHVTLFSPAPEPAILTLLATGVAGLAGVRLRKKK